jgi:hypothetical protein
MNTVKLYTMGDGTYVLQVSPTKQYHLLNGAVLRSNINVEDLQEEVFDINVQVNISNAVASAASLVTDQETLEMIMALIQEKIEDFD